MKWSILVPAREAKKFIEATLAGVAEQVETDWELLVLENGSDDGTSEIVRKFGESYPAGQVQYFNEKDIEGVSAARNCLLNWAQGEWIAFLDADDIWEPSHLRNLGAELEKGHRLVVSAIVIDYGEDQPEAVYCPPEKCLTDARAVLFEKSVIYSSSSVGITRSSFNQVGEFDTTLRIGEDRDYWLRILRDGTMGISKEPSCRYRKHEDSAMAKTLLVAEDTVAFYRKYLNTNILDRSDHINHLVKALSNYGRLVRKKDAVKARRLFFEAWSLKKTMVGLLVRALMVKL